MSVKWEDVLATCLALAEPGAPERVARVDSLGRVLAQEVLADRDYPAADLSTMDGYAVVALTDEKLRVEGENTPGASPGQPLASGTMRRIFTGAALPENATRVVPQELVEREGDFARIVKKPEAIFIRKLGAEGRTGQVILSPGARIGPAELAIMATVGAETVEVVMRPRVSHLVTGDEVMAYDEKGAPGLRIRDSNSDLVAAVLRNVGQRVADHRRVTDDRAHTIRLVSEMTRTCDVLLISGGASVGDHDHARVALEANGFQFEVHGLEVRPGKPVGLARRGSQWAVALPGNPVSHLVALHLFVLPLLLTLEGGERNGPRLLRGVLEAPVGNKSVPRRDTFWASSARWDGATWQITPCRFLSSGDLLGIAGANALLLMRTGTPVPSPGEEIFFLSLAPEFSNA